MNVTPRNIRATLAMPARSVVTCILVGVVSGSVFGGPANVGNGLIAFAKPVASSQQIFTITADGTGEQQLTSDGTPLRQGQRA